EQVLRPGRIAIGHRSSNCISDELLFERRELHASWVNEQRPGEQNDCCRRIHERTGERATDLSTSRNFLRGSAARIGQILRRLPQPHAPSNSARRATPASL